MTIPAKADYLDLFDSMHTDMVTVALPSEFSYATLGHSIHGAFTALILYDYILTFSQEVRWVWKQKITGASVIFFVNRYFMLVQVALVVTTNFAWLSVEVRPYNSLEATTLMFV